MTTRESKKTYSRFFHFIVSPKEPQDIHLVKRFIVSRDPVEWVVAYELGANCHKHIDAFCEFQQEKRQDNLLRDFKKIFTKVPKEEKRNIRVYCNDRIDPNPLWGYGYSLKEQGEIYTNLSIDKQIEAIEYYTKNYERVENAKKELQTVNKKYYSVDEIFEGIVGFTLSYLDGDRKKYNDTSHSWLIDEYIASLAEEGKIKASTFSKIREESFRKLLMLTMRGRLLTGPDIQKVNFNKSSVHPMLQ